MIDSVEKESNLNYSREILPFLLLFTFTVLIVYYTNLAITNIYFLFIIYIALRSKNDHFWLAFFILIYSYPGRLFYGNSSYLAYRLPLYRLGSGVGLAFDDLFPLAMFIKTIIVTNKRILSNKTFIFLLVFVSYYLLLSIVLGVRFSSLINTVRHFMVMLIYFPVVNLIGKTDVKKFLLLVALIAIMAIVFTALFYVLGTSVGSFLSGQNMEKRSWGHELQEFSFFESGVGIIRYVDSINILFTVFTFSWFFIISKRKILKRSYFYFTFIASLLSVILSATRGWFIGFLLVITLSLGSLKMKKTAMIKSLSILVLLATSMLLYRPFRIQFSNAIVRFTTLASVAKGELSAGGTDRRVALGSTFIEKGLEKPLFGFGISEEAENYFYSDVGMQSLFVQVGFVGLILLLVLAIRYMLYLRKVAQHQNKYYIIFLFAFIAMLFMHCTTNVMFSLTKTNYATYWVPFYFGITHLIIRHKL